MKFNWNRATTCGVPAPGVAEAMLEGLGVASAGRGGDGLGTEQRLMQIRSSAGEFLGFSHPNRVIFTSGLTHSLNQLIHGCIKEDETVITSRLEHNAVLRPLEYLSQQGTTVLECGFDSSGIIKLDELETLLKENQVDWLILSIASNVLGTIQPLAEATALAHEYDVKVVSDLAQGAGLIPIDFDKWGLAAAGIPGHKALHGPRGIGLLLLAPGIEPAPIIQGGTGSYGHDRLMPPELPIRLEAGTQNYPGILGLGAAIDYLIANPPSLKAIRSHLASLDKWLREQDCLDVYPRDCPGWDNRLPVLSFNFKNTENDIICSFLQSQGLDLRGGLLCAGPSCQDVGAPNGVVRLSPPTDASAEEFAWVKEQIKLAITTFA